MHFHGCAATISTLVKHFIPKSCTPVLFTYIMSGNIVIPRPGGFIYDVCVKHILSVKSAPTYPVWLTIGNGNKAINDFSSIAPQYFDGNWGGTVRASQYSIAEFCNGGGAIGVAIFKQNSN